MLLQENMLTHGSNIPATLQHRIIMWQWQCHIKLAGLLTGNQWRPVRSSRCVNSKC